VQKKGTKDGKALFAISQAMKDSKGCKKGTMPEADPLVEKNELKRRSKGPGSRGGGVRLACKKTGGWEEERETKCCMVGKVKDGYVPGKWGLNGFSQE